MFQNQTFQLIFFNFFDPKPTDCFQELFIFINKACYLKPPGL